VTLSYILIGILAVVFTIGLVLTAMAVHGILTTKRGGDRGEGN